MVDKIQKTNSDANNHNQTKEIRKEIDIETRTEVTPEELEAIESEIGLEQMTREPDRLNEDNLYSSLDESEFAPSYGTGLKGEPTDHAGRKVHDLHSPRFDEADSILTGGDLDANYEEADAVGDEAVGGTVATPDQDIVDNLGAAVGLEMRDRDLWKRTPRSSLRTNQILEHRDEDRWETDPQSSEDYEERQDD
ncbi:hypothetical protein Sta7437_2695 [Stanieria cyanosphaera PCC 7437]|uniref:Uncharacterized protein n=1 Tax=Stanieria cyanosphaera (strain ATCC 29371 / PCC 7437) TaxID=111780 RepID=K9XVV7_STAC7|nr:DUF6335 family protein [Stanieria cyanosphaera]AFZ36221.1 hypothetical protein Sta7437_2695 [Stanieria cyanosphaera PCC 7437]